MSNSPENEKPKASEPSFNDLEKINVGQKKQKPKKVDFRDKRKVVRFELRSRSLKDPTRARDPNASEHVLVPVEIGEDVQEDIYRRIHQEIGAVDEAEEDFIDEEEEGSEKQKNGIGSQYNEIFGMKDDGVDYSRFYKVIDPERSGGVFIARDGSIHKSEGSEQIDALAATLGYDTDVFGAPDDNLPPMIDDGDNPMTAGMDLDLLTAMDDDDAEPLPDDFVSRMLDLESQEKGPQDWTWDDAANLHDDEDGEEFDSDFDDEEFYDGKPRTHVGPKSVTSEAPSHMSTISHRSEAMDLVEERVEHIVNHLINEEEESDSEYDVVDWNDVIEDMEKHQAHLPDKIDISVPKVDAAQLSDNEHEEEEEQKIRKPDLDCQSYISTLSNTENRPQLVREQPRAKKQKKQKEEPQPVEIPEAPSFQPKPGETKEEAKARKKAIKEYQKAKRAAKKERQREFSKAGQLVKKSIAASGGARGQRITPLE